MHPDLMLLHFFWYTENTFDDTQVNWVLLKIFACYMDKTINKDSQGKQDNT